MNRIQEALMHLHKIVMFVPDEVQDELGEVERLLKEELLERTMRQTDNPPPCPNQRYNYVEERYYCIKALEKQCQVDCIVHRQKLKGLPEQELEQKKQRLEAELERLIPLMVNKYKESEGEKE